jgi:drug/metabolite transporter (DMT)-like permease
VLLTALIYRRPISRPQCWALVLSYAGILLVYGNDPQVASPDVTLGAMLVFSSAVVFAFFLTGSGHFISRFGSRRFTAYSMSIACIATIAHFLVNKPIEQLMVSKKVFGLSLMLALISTVAPAFLMNAGIRRMGADHASIIGTVGPVATLAMAYVLLDETLDTPQIIGSILVLGGVMLVSLTKRTA